LGHALHVDQLLDELLQLVAAEAQLAPQGPDGEPATKLTRQV